MSTERDRPPRVVSRRWLPAGLRGKYDRRSLRPDLSAGLVLGVESVPDGLASGLLAGVNPLAGLYGYLYGMAGAALFTSSSFMAVQATGAMALVVADTDLSTFEDPDRALFTLAVLTGAVMIVAGLIRAGTLLRFVPTAVMTGFVTAVGINIVLGQLSNFTGYDAPGENRVLRALELVFHPWRIDPATIFVGVATLVSIVVLTRTRLRSLGSWWRSPWVRFWPPGWRAGTTPRSPWSATSPTCPVPCPGWCCPVWETPWSCCFRRCPWRSSD